MSKRKEIEGQESESPAERRRRMEDAILALNRADQRTPEVREQEIEDQAERRRRLEDARLFAPRPINFNELNMGDVRPAAPGLNMGAVRPAAPELNMGAARPAMTLEQMFDTMRPVTRSNEPTRFTTEPRRGGKTKKRRKTRMIKKRSKKEKRLKKI